MTTQFYEQTASDMAKLRHSNTQKMTIAQGEATAIVALADTSINDMIKEHVNNGTEWNAIAETAGIHVNIDPDLEFGPENESPEAREKRVAELERERKNQQIRNLTKMRNSDVWWRAAKELMSWRYAAGGLKRFHEGLVEHGVIDPKRVPDTIKTMGVTRGRKSLYLTAPRKYDRS